jgi:cerevisin
MSYTFSYGQPAGDNVDVYIIDTGVNTAHSEFEGRASFGFAAGTMQKIDGHGHGTHCAGTAAGKTYGVAKKANIIGVKVLSDNGQGTTSNIVEGLGWVLNNTLSTGRRSIGSMSLGGDPSDALEEAVTKCLNAGITIVAAAGNSAKDASTASPARIPGVITVGASDINNGMASFSNFGSVVDIFAPGVDITSAWFTDPNDSKKLSGTSMAAPHVAGLAAYLLSQDGSLKPDTMQSKIVSMATKNAVTGTPSGTTNILAFNGGVLGGGGSAPATVPSTTPATSKVGCPSWWPNCPWKNW